MATDKETKTPQPQDVADALKQLETLGVDIGNLGDVFKNLQNMTTKLMPVIDKKEFTVKDITFRASLAKPGIITIGGTDMKTMERLYEALQAIITNLP